jgi:NAD(P)-dependent dehydrogenase (short-subunit alcohol dehydrogenase family)
MSEFDERRVLVTGTASGAGKATATAFYDAGATVIGVDIADQGHVGWRTLHADLSDTDSVKAVIADAGPVDILVNAHGLLQPMEIEDITPADFDRAIAINLTSVFFLCQGFAPTMLDQGWGRIINFSSVVARTGGVTSAAYAAAKAGVIAMTKSMARKYAPSAVTVNSIAPAAIDTPLNAFLTPEQRANVESAIPLGRFSQPEEFAAVVLFLAGNDAGYITGATIDVNGGWVMA